MSKAVTTATLAGRVALVTRASSGIGAAPAERLAELGAKVAVAARREENVDNLVAPDHLAGGTALTLPLDVTQRDAVAEASQQVAE